MDEQPVGVTELGQRRREPHERRVRVADEARQDAEPGAGADGFELQRDPRGAHARATLAEVSHQEGHRAEILVRRVVRHPRARAPARLGPCRRLRLDQARRAVDRRLDRPETDANEVVARQEPVPNPQIGFTPIQIRLAVRLGQLDREVGVPGAQAPQARGEEARRPFARGDPHDATAVVAEGHPPAIDGRGRFGHALRHRHEVLAPLRQPMTIRGALEQPCAQALLELTEMADHRGLAEAEHASGPSQAPGLGDGEKHPEIVPLHGARLATSKGRTRSECGAGRSASGGFRAGAGDGGVPDQGGTHDVRQRVPRSLHRQGASAGSRGAGCAALDASRAARPRRDSRRGPADEARALVAGVSRVGCSSHASQDVE